MKISEAWLREWVNPPLTTKALANQLTMAGLEVDAIDPVAGSFDKVVVAKVVATRPHPQADRLTLCDVDPGNGQLLHVVCGATNVRAGLTVALAMIGADLPGDLQIKETKLRGELSQGMLCAANELGLLDASEGIMELPDDAPLGVSLRDYLKLDDHVFDLNITPNRADCLSVLGIARDVAALNKLPLRQWSPDVVSPTIDNKINVHLNASQACPLYAGRMITGIDPDATTPLFIKERLRRSDIRPTHPVVDVLNYIMLELGQPMHAFDCARIQGDIQVRYAKNGEEITSLGEQVCSLNDQVVVIADDTHALAIAGVIGGAFSAVQIKTTAVWLESSYFDPKAIAGVARQFGLSSDASHRFERGVDPNQVVVALEAATALMQSIVGGQIGPIVQQKTPEFSFAPIEISFNPKQVLRLSGVDVLPEEIEAILTHLGMLVVRQASNWQVTVPSYRFDLRLDVDLVEEIVRMVGYDKIPAQAVETTMRAGTIDPVEQFSMQVMTFLAHRGYRETISYSFVDPELQRALYPDIPAKALLNPISSELSEMRLGLWPGLLASMLHNVHRQQPALKLCETGKIFLVDDNDSVVEKVVCAGLITGEYGQFNWNDVSAKYDFYDMKGDLQALFEALQHPDITFVAGTHPALHPGKAANIMFAGQSIGWIGALHPRLLDGLDLCNDVVLFEFMVSELQDKQPVVYRSISKYPQIRRDLSLLVDEQVSASDVEAIVREVVAPQYLKSFYVFDVYTGGGLALDHKKSMAIGLVLQSDERTLNDVDVNAIMTDVVKALEQHVAAELRTAAE